MHAHRRLWLATLTVLLPQAAAVAQGVPIGFEEQYALAEDRAAALEQLIPGTEDFYEYHCRDAAHRRAWGEHDNLLKAWIGRHGRTQRVLTAENRRALLTYEQDPNATMRHLVRRLGVNFGHQRQIPGAAPDVPTALDPRAISAATLTARALRGHRGSTNGFQPRALRDLATTRLDDRQLMSLLSRLQRPDVANLPALVVRNLQDRSSRGFGSLAIHRHLLLDQLEECARLLPSLLSDNNFVETYLPRLLPSADVDWRRDRGARVAYLQRLQAFADRLPPPYNSLKAHVLYHRLRDDLAAGTPDLGRFRAYLRLPRPGHYVHPRLRQENTSVRVDPGRGFPTGLPPIGDDEPLVRAYLAHALRDADSFDSFAEVLDPTYLRRQFAEIKILAGRGDMERWYSLLDDPGYYEALKERVEIEFPPTQRTDYGDEDPVTIDVDLKNVDTLLVKVFEINTFNYYREVGREVDASINLDGLVANHEETHSYDDNPLRRVRRQFALPAVQRPGVYVVEFIGNGLASRAVLHKGRLWHTERASAAGHAFAVRDGDGNVLEDASVWIGGRDYRADDDGEITVPFSTAPGRKAVILRHGDRAALAEFEHHTESYGLQAGIHVEREALRAGGRAQVVVRPTLLLNGRPISLSELTERRVRITATDTQGIGSTVDVRDPEFDDEREWQHELSVPTNIVEVQVSVSGTVRSLSRGEDVQLGPVTRSFALNRIDTTPQTGCPLIGRTPEGYFIDLLGKNGEPRAGRALHLRLSHRDYTDPVDVTLKTDEGGRIHLGPLLGIETLQVSGFPWAVGAVRLRDAVRTYPPVLHGLAGQTIRVPYLGPAGAATRQSVSLLRLRGGVFEADAIEHTAVAGGFVELRDLTPGDYSLWLIEQDRHFTVRITAGAPRGGWTAGAGRNLEQPAKRPLHVTRTSIDGDHLVVQLANAGVDARVHVGATRYLPAYEAFALRGPAHPGLRWMPSTPEGSSFHSGREIGDEYRYILERRLLPRYPGNLLRRPGLLLNPWALEETATAIGLGGGAGGKFGGRGGHRQRPGTAAAGDDAAALESAPGTYANLDFLPAGAPLHTNATPDADGVVRVPLAALGDGALLHVLATDDRDTVYTTRVRAETPLAPRERALENALDPARHLSQEQRIEFIAAGESAVLADAAHAEAQTFDTLAGVHRLFMAQTDDADLAKFAFVTRWHEQSDEQKRALYSEHACHELHFFLHQKDPAFFAAVVQPYLANKVHQTFLDHWLLGADLERYLEPWAFARLNLVERILLARRLTAQRDSVRRLVADLHDLLPPDPAKLDRLMRATLRNKDLDKAGELRARLGEARRALRSDSRSQQDRAAGEEMDMERAAAPEPAEEAEEAPNAVTGSDEFFMGGARRKEEAKQREQGKALYRQVDPTQRFVEHNYWHRRIEEQVGDWIAVNGFWRDFAAAGDGPFVSGRFAEATGSFAEMMFALSVLDLPFAAGEHGTEVDGRRVTLQANSPLLLVRQEIVDTAVRADTAPLLVTQNLYRLDDRYRFEGNERRDKFVTDEFLIGITYGCQVVATNPTSAPRQIRLLLQIPRGAIPVNNGFATRSVPLRLEPYSTATVEYAFYFPASGEFTHYPVHVSDGEGLLAHAESRTLRAVATPSRIDTSSWEHISQNGSTEAVLAYLDGHNLARIDLSQIAWRMRDANAFAAVLDRLRSRHVYHPVLWSYGLHHGDAAVTREYLQHADGFIAQCGRWLDSPLLSIDPIERHAYQHVEYEPLINGRAHRFGKRREILNADFARQYAALLLILADRPQLDANDWMSVTYYLLLQDRVHEALRSFAKVDPQQLHSELQYDYMRAYLAFFSETPATARAIAERYADHPVSRWRAMFQDVLHQLDEASGMGAQRSDPDNRVQAQNELAAAEPSLELRVESRRVHLRHQNLEQCSVSYYLMDVEFLFSTHPFVQQGSGAFAYVKPNREDRVALAAADRETVFDLPAEFANANVLVEVRGAGLVQRQPYFANSMAVRMIDSYGQLEVTDHDRGRPMPRVYVKVFARRAGGGVVFYKDGYTDLRGRFDYASLSGAHGDVERFAILVLSEEAGATIREAAPPLQ